MKAGAACTAYWRSFRLLWVMLGSWIALILLLPTEVRAEVSIQVEVGYGVGFLDTGSADGALPFQSMPVMLMMGKERIFDSPFSLSGVFQNHFVSYQQDGSTYDGIDSMAGLALGLTMVNFTSSHLRLQGSYFSDASLSVTSDTSATVNGKTYDHSTLTTYKSGPVAEAAILYLYELTKGQFNRHERLRYGFALRALNQPLVSRDIKVATSNRDLVSRQILKEDVDYRVSLVSLTFSVGYAF